VKATQDNRQANFRSSLGPDALMIHRMVAREGISQLFEIQLTVVSEDENIDLNQIIGQHARVELELPGGGFRYFSGHVVEFGFNSFRDNFAEYEVTLRPWFWLLTRANDIRIFQTKSAPEIIKDVCQQHGFTDIDDRTSGHDPIEFCVQYRESDFTFLSRLMEEHGIYYFFVHEENKHILVLCDESTMHDKFGGYEIVPWYPPESNEHREKEHLDDWSMRRAVRSGTVTLRDFDFTKPKTDLEVRAQQPKPHEQAEFEQYDYPGRYKEVLRGESLARIRRESEQADHEVLFGRGNARGLKPGFRFALELFPRADQNRSYLLLAVTHDISQGSYDSGGSDPDESFEYNCMIEAMPDDQPYRPPMITPRPLVHGPQTAIVVGEAGKEISTDQYGRIKVQFHWDRLGSNDQDSSCWIRVSQAWAGKGWGAQFIPRIGHEVIVEFLEGDPDRPIVTGSVYNADNMPPYGLPANATQSGIKTRSSKSGTKDNFNEIRFEDKKGSEELYLHAEKDMNTQVENCQAAEIGVDRQVTVGNNETHHVKNKREKTVDADETTSIGTSRTVSIGTNEDLTVGASRNTTISASETLNVGSSRSATIAASDSLTAGASVSMTAGGSVSIASGGSVSITAAGGISLASPPGVSITHNAHEDLGLIKRDIDQMREEIASLKKTSVATSQSSVGVSMSQTGVGVDNKGVSSSITQVSDSFVNLALGMKNINIETNVLSLKDASLFLIG